MVEHCGMCISQDQEVVKGCEKMFDDDSNVDEGA